MKISKCPPMADMSSYHDALRISCQTLMPKVPQMHSPCREPIKSLKPTPTYQAQSQFASLGGQELTNQIATITINLLEKGNHVKLETCYNFL